MAETAISPLLQQQPLSNGSSLMPNLQQQPQNNGFGDISSVNTTNNNVNNSTPVNSQQIATESKQSDSINQMNSSNINVNNLEPEQFRKVFIGSLSYRMEDSAFREYFAKYGDVLDCIIMRDRDGRSRGFGFVTYSQSSMVDNLMRHRPHVLDSREIEPKRAVPREESSKPEMQTTAKKLYLGGVREPLQEQDLKEYFSKYGNIVDCVVMKDKDGKHRGFGFVEFDDYDPVDKIVLEKHHVISGRPLDVQKALPKDQSGRNNPRGGGGGGGGGYGGNRRGNMGGNQGPNRGNMGGGNQGDYGANMGGGGGFTNFGGSNMGGNDAFGAFGPQGGNNFGGPPQQGGFGQGYGQGQGGGPMRGRGGPRGGGGPYGGGNRGGGRGGQGRGGGGGRGGGRGGL
ncbi:unnamed protein product [Didymodactylos carnosus]|uniref:RRM domain-containing protein n=1 Tax=Didymodactylos carnosus TaxID=1234261 RepID=A0A814GXD3_9BILA|nr:unnamed protein product [Didymodactylos carnosus]CAF3774156.1 unnamed protein product [Didymodactylos carnosus]